MKYEIERKAPGDVNYSKVGELNPQPGNILTNHNYQFTNTLSNVTQELFHTGSGKSLIQLQQLLPPFILIQPLKHYVQLPGYRSLPIPILPGTKICHSSQSPTGSSATLIVETNYAIANMPIAMYDMKGRLMMQLPSIKSSRKSYQLIYP